MTIADYPRFCPVAMAASLLEPRWTMLVLSELWSGSSRFNDIQRGVPGMSPGLLARRLREMETNGLVTRGGPDRRDYVTTPFADELQPLILGLGAWAHRNADCDLSLQHLDARLLMWKIRRKIDRLHLPRQRCVIEFVLKDPAGRVGRYWLVARPGDETDLCFSDPKDEVDLFVETDLRTLTSAWMGHSRFEDEIASERIVLIGNVLLARSLTRWLVCSSFAAIGQDRHRPPSAAERAL